jgi:hypothetical protein
VSDSLDMNPVQVENLERLRPPPEARPSYRSTLRIDIRTYLERELVTVIDRVKADDPKSRGMWVGKRHLAAIHGCEARHLAEDERPFEWSVPLARGSVAHKAIELSMHMAGRRDPSELVDDAIGRIIDRESGLGDFLRRADEASTAELRSEASALTAGFLDTFPPLKRGWRPATEVSKRSELCNDGLTLAGKFDLTLGGPNDTTAGRVIIDVKTGGFAPEHREDLRFYALIETLHTGVPPLIVATHYVESGRLQAETVDEDLIWAAALRTIDGVERLAELQADPSTAVKKAGPACRWCPIADTCDVGQAWLNHQDDW